MELRTWRLSGGHTMGHVRQHLRPMPCDQTWHGFMRSISPIFRTIAKTCTRICGCPGRARRLSGAGRSQTSILMPEPTMSVASPDTNRRLVGRGSVLAKGVASYHCVFWEAQSMWRSLLSGHRIFSDSSWGGMSGRGKGQSETTRGPAGHISAFEGAKQDPEADSASAMGVVELDLLGRGDVSLLVHHSAASGGELCRLMTDFRTERDSMGEVRLPAQAYYGARRSGPSRTSPSPASRCRPS